MPSKHDSFSIAVLFNSLDKHTLLIIYSLMHLTTHSLIYPTFLSIAILK